MPITHRPPTRWIVFKDHHQVSLCDITPDAVNFPKSHIHMDGRVLRKLGLTTARNYVAKILGSKNGSGKAYEKFFANELKPFMDNNNLISPADLISTQQTSSIPSFTPKQVADRIFKGDQIPSKIFTGWNIPWDEYDSGDAPFWKIATGGLFLPQTFPPAKGFARLIEALGDSDDCTQFFKAASLELGLSPEKVISNGHKHGKSFTQERCFDETIHRMRLYCPNCNSMLGNLFLRFPERTELKGHCNQYYPASMTEEAVAEAKEEARITVELFRRWVEFKKTGWVKVLPFNANLVFLSDNSGRYDFLIRGAKDRLFSHKIFGTKSDTTKMPKAHDTYHFERWLHFEYDGWEEKDRDAAERAYYKNGEIKDYPRATLFRDYLKSTGKYHPNQMTGNSLLPGFTPVRMQDGRKMAISDLITIERFRTYLLRNPDCIHAGSRMLGAVNPDIYPKNHKESDREMALRTSGLCVISEQDFDESGAALPVAVTWNDACAFAKSFQEETNFPVRLPHCDEYQELFKDLIPSFEKNEDLKTALFKGRSKDGICYEVLRREEKTYHSSKDFQHYARSQVQTREKKHISGIKTLVASDFGEWLSAPHRAINSLTHTHVHYPEGPLNDIVGVGSSGQYKGAKIGFRLCYEMTD